jgi:nickel/cobalt transporter (NiCoT) family protein
MAIALSKKGHYEWEEFRQNLKRSPFTSFQKRAIGVFVLLGSGNIAAWVWAFIVLRNDVVLLGTALLAFSLGLRHGVDADHIAAIDNVTRKLMHEHRRPLSVGLFFALGHSSVVIVASFAVFATASAVEHQLTGIKEIVEVISTSVSALFLVAIALLNLLIFRDVYEAFKRVKETGNCTDKDIDLQGSHGGVLTRLFRAIFGIISKPWHMYPLGLLFAFGFETATEIALFGISATAAGKGLSISSMMVFPVLFAVGMILVDTTDGILMVGAYGWAFVKPVRKLYYNMTITFVSVLVALFIGGVEAIGLIKDELNLSGGIWDLVGSLNDNFGILGFTIIAVFIASWAGSILLYRLKGYHRVE